MRIIGMHTKRSITFKNSNKQYFEHKRLQPTVSHLSFYDGERVVVFARAAHVCNIIVVL